MTTTNISIHPPRVGWDNTQADGLPDADISIHPPRVGWDLFGGVRHFGDVMPISIHPPRVGWDSRNIQYSSRCIGDF